MNRLPAILILFFLLTAASFAQEFKSFSNTTPGFKKPAGEKKAGLPFSLYDSPSSSNSLTSFDLSSPNSSPYKKADISTPLFVTAIIAVFINPILVFEDKKVFWGLTKEISLAFYPYGRLNFEYSFLFRTFNKNHLRLSYNYDFIEHSRSDWVMYRTSAGAGFFTDTKHTGAFIQASPGFFIAAPFFVFDLYLKYRYTHIFDKNKSDIHDISLGCGFVF